MKLRIVLAALLCAALAAPVVASNISGFSDVADRHAVAVDYVNRRGLLPPDARADEGKYGARLRVDADAIAQAIRLIGDTEEGGYIRREEMASFVLAGIQKLRELRAPATTTTTAKPVKEDGSLRYPFQGGVSWSDAGWHFTVAGVIDNAWGDIYRMNQFNDPPRNGNRYLLVGLGVEYTGDGEGWVGGFSFRAVTPSGQQIDRCGASVIDEKLRGTIVSGGWKFGVVCLEAPVGEMPHLLVSRSGFKSAIVSLSSADYSDRANA